jgi:hypothetical protein
MILYHWQLRVRRLGVKEVRVACVALEEMVKLVGVRLEVSHY